MRPPRIPAVVLACAVVSFTFVPSLRADWIPTNIAGGADAEIRDHQPATNFGASTELAVRVLDIFPPGDTNDTADRFSAMYTRFNIAGQTIPNPFVAAFRLCFRNTNLTPMRIQDMDTPNLSHRVTFSVYGLTPAAPAWDESTITFSNAPGITSDGNIGDNDVNLKTSPVPAFPIVVTLGSVTLPPIGVQNRLPVGGSMVFRSAAFNNFISSALTAGATQVTLITVISHTGKEAVASWRNFNYLFVPKEMTTLTADTGYDSDITNPNNPLGSPHSGANNTDGAFSPAIRFDPVPVPEIDAINVGANQVDLQLEPTVAGYPFHIERSHELSSWLHIATVPGATIPVIFSDERLPGHTKDFYRVRR